MTSLSLGLLPRPFQLFSEAVGQVLVNLGFEEDTYICRALVPKCKPQLGHSNSMPMVLSLMGESWCSLEANFFLREFTFFSTEFPMFSDNKLLLASKINGRTLSYPTPSLLFARQVNLN
jgi:hypothetical protein